MTGPGGLRLIPRTGPLVPPTGSTRPGPELQPRRGWTADGGPIEPPGEWGPAAFTLSASANISAAGADTTTARLTAPGGSFSAGGRVDDSGTTPSTTITASGYTEHEWAIEALPAAANGDVYEFRVIRADGAELAAYTVTPQWTIGSGVPTTNAPATVAPVTVTATSATALVQPAAGSSAVATTGQPATTQVRPTAGAAPVAATGQPATAAVQTAAGSAPATTTAPAPAVIVAAQAGVASVAAVASNATVSTATTTTANAGSVPVAVAANTPTAQVLAQAGTATVATAAPAPSATVAATAAQAPVAVTAANTSGGTGPPTLLQTWALASADPQSISIPATTGRDIYLLINTAATVATPAGWTLVTSRVATMGTYLWRLPAASHSGGSISVDLDLAAARPLTAVALDAPTTATAYYASLVAAIDPPGSTSYSTDAHTFTQADYAFPVWCFHQPSFAGTPPAFTVSAISPPGSWLFADTGWAGTGTTADEGTRILVGETVGLALTAGAATVTLSAAGPSGSAVGFVAFDLAGVVTTGAPVAPVAATANPAITTVAPQAGTGTATLTAQPATPTVLAQASVATVATQGQAATVNTSSSTNAVAGVASVGVTASPAVASVRAAATSSPVGTAGLFDAGSLPILQLIMDNPVGITVTASNATVSTTTGPTNANAASAPVTLTAGPALATVRPAAVAAPVSTAAPAPVATVRANASGAAVGVVSQPANAQTSNQVLAQASVAAVTATATTMGATVRPAAGASSVATSAAGPLGQIGARPGGAVILVTALLMLAQARAQAASAPIAVAARQPLMGSAGATWWVWHAGALVRHRALLDGVHPTTATIT